MSYETINHVIYYLSPSKDFYAVGKNDSSEATALTPNSYDGNVVIEEMVKGKRVLEISSNAFRSTSIKKVTIRAKIQKIHDFAFAFCTKLEYINVPSTVTYIGNCAFFFGSYQGKTIELTMIVEFAAGRTQNFLIGAHGFSFRSLIYIIYPSDLAPEFINDQPFHNTAEVVICAPTSFSFFSRQTETNMSKCPAPQYRPRKCQTYNARKNRGRFILSSFLIFLFTERIVNVKEPAAAKIE